MALPRSARAFDRDVLAQADGWGASTVAASRSSTPRGSWRREARWTLPSPGHRSRSPSRRLRCSWLPAGGSSRSTSRRGRRDPRCAICWRTRPASGHGPAEGDVGTRRRTRIYSNSGYDVLAAARGRGRAAVRRGRARLGAPAAGDDGVEPRRPPRRAGRDAADLAALTTSCSSRVLTAESASMASTVAFAGLRGVLPGFGLQEPCDWGLGLEIRGSKSPHWTGTATRRRRSGTSGEAAPSSGSTRSRASRSSRSPTGRSDPGRARPGRRSPMRCSRRRARRATAPRPLPAPAARLALDRPHDPRRHPAAVEAAGLRRRSLVADPRLVHQPGVEREVAADRLEAGLGSSYDQATLGAAAAA